MDGVGNGVQREDNNLLQRSQLCQHGEFRHVSVSERQQSRPCGQNLCGAFVTAVLATNFEPFFFLTNGGRRHDKSACISTTMVSFSTKIVRLGCCMVMITTCSQNLCRPFLSLKRVIYYLIIYAAQFFPYQECNLRGTIFPYQECNKSSKYHTATSEYRFET